MATVERFTVMSVPGNLDDGSDTSWFVFDRDTRRSVRRGTGDLGRQRAIARAWFLARQHERERAAARDVPLATLREQVSNGDHSAACVYEDAVREQIQIGQFVRLPGSIFRLAIVVGYGTRDKRFRVCRWSGLGERRRFYAPILVDLVHPLTRTDLLGRKGASVRAARAVVESRGAVRHVHGDLMVAAVAL